MAGTGEGSALCVACGLCCDGSLFRFLPLGADRPERYRALGLPVVVQSRQLAMPLPCGRLQDRACTVYEARPQGCRDYRCRALDGVARGTLPLAEALEAVREARRRVARVAALWPVDGPVVQRATEAALAGTLPGPALEALEAARAWIDDALHWPA